MNHTSGILIFRIFFRTSLVPVPLPPQSHILFLHYLNCLTPLHFFRTYNPTSCIIAMAMAIIATSLKPFHRYLASKLHFHAAGLQYSEITILLQILRPQFHLCNVGKHRQIHENIYTCCLSPTTLNFNCNLLHNSIHTNFNPSNMPPHSDDSSFDIPNSKIEFKSTTNLP